MATWLYRIGEAAARRAWAVILIWVFIIAGVAGAYATFHGKLSNTFTMPGTQTQQLSDELAQRFPSANRGSGQIILTTGNGAALTEEQKQAFSIALKKLTSEVPSVDAVTDPFTTTSKLAEAKTQLDEAHAKIDAAPSQIEEGKKQLSTAASQIEEGTKQIAESEKKLDDSQAQITSGQEQLTSAQKQLDDTQAQLKSGYTQAEAAGSPADTMEQLNTQQAQLTEQQNALNQQRDTLAESQKQVDAGRAEIASKKEELAEGQKKLDKQRDQLQKSERELPAQREQLERQQKLYDFAVGYRMVSEDQSTAIATVSFKKKIFEVPSADLQKVMSDIESANLHGAIVHFDANLSESALGGGSHTGEVAGMVIAFIVLMVMLGTLVAAGLPILMSLVGVVVGVLGTLSLSSIVQMSSTAYTLGLMLGLAVGIDYSLFILNRYRTNLLEGMPKNRAIALANGTSGNAVIFAASTVIIALVALNVTGIPFLGVMGNAAAFCVVVAALIAVTLTPAVLSLAGTKVMPKKLWASIDTPQKIVERRAQDAERTEKPNGWLRLVLARPLLTLVAGSLALLAVAAPMSQMRLGLPDASNYPSDSAAYKSYALVKDKFGEGMSAPLVAVAHTPANMSEEQAQQAQIDIASAVKERGGANVQAVVPGGMTDDRTLLIFQVIPAHSASSVETEELVHELRAVTVPVQGSEVSLGIAGQTSGNIDVSEVLAQKLPLYLGVVMGLSFLVLILVFRSIMVPLVASVGFLFSVLASFGAVVSIYQLGFMGSLFGVDHPGPVLSFLPTLLIGILFGLAMDYQMFLVTGMREAYVHGKDAVTAIVSGYNHAVRVVVAAAIIMISVFGGFIFADSTMIRPMGFGLAFGVLVDACIVRMTLTPAVMALLGDKAWWMPKWLDRLTPNMDVEGAALSEKMREKIQYERESTFDGSGNR
ncbi:MMPL family transporter [Rothia mucilaginosa]|uniref:MMPL family transporter n=1 Tax=Rothia mucilaginosa TaxID=43675 RepID=UPI00195C6A3E|nr:MMPL family transporter [Rothia mucilaginosa]VTY09313.1 Membrane protein YdfJ [Rothia mucilaginosa]